MRAVLVFLFPPLGEYSIRLPGSGRPASSAAYRLLPGRRMQSMLPRGRKQGCAIFDPLGDGLSQWFQQSGGFAYPIRHGRAIQINTLASIDL